MNLLLIFLLVNALNGFIYHEKPSPRRMQLINHPGKNRHSKRKLYLDDLQTNNGSYSLNQMDNTNTNVYEMQSHNRRNAQMRQVGTWFGDVDLSVDDFRETVSQKLDQLNMSLQRPKIPVPGFGAGLVPPYAPGSMISSMPSNQIVILSSVPSTVGSVQPNSTIGTE